MELVTWANERAARAVVIDSQRKQLVTLSNKLAVGIRAIDEQHMKLVDLVNQLGDAMYSGKGRDMLDEALAILENYAHYHFDTEERLMVAHEYRESESHRHGHRLFTKTIERLRHQFDSGQVVVSTEVLFFLGEWINAHITKSDRELGFTLRQLGVR